MRQRTAPGGARRPQRERYKGPLGVLINPIDRRLRGRGLHMYPVIGPLNRRLHRIVWKLSRSDTVVVDGHDILLDELDSLALSDNRPYEPVETAWYLKHVRLGDLVVEVGANIGYFSLILARQTGPTGHVISFEPDPELNRILRRNINVNGYPWVDVREAAVADAPGTLSFYRSATSSGDHRLFSHGDDRDVLLVEAVRLDNEFAGVGRRIDLVKMDFQGAEPLAIAGMAETLRHNPPRLMHIEWWPHGLVGMGHDPRTMVRTLREFGYHVAAEGSTDPFDEESALATLTPESLKFVNLICTHDSAT